MEFLDLAKKRYSCRKYKSDKVEEEKINKILEAARLAPTAANNQPCRILTIQSEEGLEKMKKVTNFTFDAPPCFCRVFRFERMLVSSFRRLEQRKHRPINCSHTYDSGSC